MADFGSLEEVNQLAVDVDLLDATCSETNRALKLRVSLDLANLVLNDHWGCLPAINICQDISTNPLRVGNYDICAGKIFW
jgi:hypothetical protein